MEYTEDFNAFWKAYRSPDLKNSSKLGAFQAWQKTIKSRPSLEIMLACVEAYDNWLIAERAKNKNGFPAKCHAATFLSPRQERWEGFLDDAEAILATQKPQDGHSQADLSATAKSWTPGWLAALKAAGVEPNQIEHWFLPATLIYRVGQDKVEIRSPSQFHRDELERRFGEVIRKAFGPDVQLTVSAKKSPT